MSDLFECSICIELYSARRDDCFVTTRCGHVFHKHCIEDAISISGARCPNCRKKTDKRNLFIMQGIQPYRSVKKFKITVIGDGTVGKTCLSRQYAEATFSEHTTLTVGQDFWTKQVQVGEELVQLQIWDTSGQEKFQSLTHQHVRGSQGVIIAYDVSNVKTLLHTRAWLQFANDHAPNAVKILVGCKSDLSKWKEHDNEAEQIAESLSLNRYSTSAKNDENVQAVFKGLICLILQNPFLVREARLANQNNNIRLNHNPQSEGDSFCKKFWTCHWS